MKKNILFFLWLVVSINVFGMEERIKSEENLNQEADDLDPILEELRDLFSIFERITVGQITERLEKIAKVEQREKFVKFGQNLKSISKKFSDAIKKYEKIQQEEKILPVTYLASEADQGLIRVRTQWDEYRCLEKALSSSNEFRELIARAKKEQGDDFKPIEVKFDAKYRVAFEYMLMMLHGNTKFQITSKNKSRAFQDLSPRQYLDFIYLSKKFGCHEEEMQSFIAKNWDHFNFLSEQVEESLRDNNFDLRRDIYFLNDHLAFLPEWAIEYFLKDPRFRTDSENSIFFLLELWAQKKSKSLAIRAEYIKPMLKYIRWQNISHEYLVTTIKSLFNKYDAREFEDYYELAVNFKLLDFEAKFGNETKIMKISELNEKIKSLAADLKYSLNLSPHLKTPNGADNKFMFKALFRDVDQWTMDAKYYSSPVISNGYSWYFFLNPMKNEETGLSSLLGFLRCTSASDCPHYIPVESQIRAIENDEKPRIFSKMSIEFTDNEKAIGGMISLPQISFVDMALQSGDTLREIKVFDIPETWESIVAGKSKLVTKNKTITIIMSIDYPALSEEKLRELIDPKFWQLDRMKIKEEKISEVKIKEEKTGDVGNKKEKSNYVDIEIKEEKIDENIN